MPRKSSKPRNRQIKFRKYVTSESQTLAGAQRCAKLGQLIGSALPPSQPLPQEVEGKLLTASKELGELHREKLFPKSTPENSQPTPVSLPTAKPGVTPLTSSQDLREGEVLRIMKDLNPRKDPGPDAIGNAILINCADALVNHMEHLVRHCLLLGIHPDGFKVTIPIGIPKQDKQDKLRPIALISCVGKIIEKVVSRRLGDLLSRSRASTPLSNTA